MFSQGILLAYQVTIRIVAKNYFLCITHRPLDQPVQAIDCVIRFPNDLIVAIFDDFAGYIAYLIQGVGGGIAPIVADRGQALRSVVAVCINFSCRRVIIRKFINFIINPSKLQKWIGVLGCSVVNGRKLAVLLACIANIQPVCGDFTIWKVPVEK